MDFPSSSTRPMSGLKAAIAAAAPVPADRYVAEARSILADLGIFRTFTGRQKKIALAELLRMIEVC